MLVKLLDGYDIAAVKGLVTLDGPPILTSIAKLAQILTSL